MSQESKVQILKDRAEMLKKVRSFFYDKNIIEVDPSIINKTPTIDNNIFSIEAFPLKDKAFYLHTSPEFLMKRLIAMGLKDIYFLGHVFRKDENGKKHSVEFTMIEWYRYNISFDGFISEVIDLTKLFISLKKIEKISYFDLFSRFLNINFLTSNISDLKKNCEKFNILLSSNFSKDDLLNLLLDHIMENLVSKETLYIVYDFPKSQASLAQTYVNEIGEFAKRFELFFSGYELANGYLELTDKEILKKRLKNKIIPDEKLLDSLKSLKDFYGIAVGFDRLFMLKKSLTDIKDAICFSIDEI